MTSRTAEKGTHRSRRVVPALACALLAAVALSGIVGYGQAAAPAPGAAGKTAVLEKARYFGQCEIFLLNGKPGSYEARVYNTTPLNDCPPAKFDAIDAVGAAQTNAADLAWKNPRRFWTMDRLTIALVGEPREFDGLMFSFVARMTMPPKFTPGAGQAGFAFQPTQIRRNSKYEYFKGQPVFLLRSADEKTWVMQTYTTHTDKTLTSADLPSLAKRLKLPAGWQFKAVTLDRDLAITTTGLANIVPDNLENMYQGCIDGVCNFDPWK